jgi:endonuclease/exonuclease/phosphatase family metal-dependent hydrolase
MNLKILQYNIRTGFHELQDRKWILDFKRMKYAQKLVEEYNPDVLLLNEAYFVGKNPCGLFMDYQKIFGFEYYYAGAHDKPYEERGNVILSKYPISARNLSATYFSWIYAFLDICGLKLNVNLVHLSPTPVKRELQRTTSIGKVLKKAKSPAVIAGDFNAISCLDDYDKNIMIRDFNFEKDPKSFVEDILKRDATRAVIKEGFNDSFKEKNKKWDFTIPTDMLSKNKKTGMRIDFTFCSKDIKVISSKIIKDKNSEIASDHYPSLTEVEVGG